MILLKLGRAGEAVAMLHGCGRPDPDRPVYFHLAEAQKAAGKPNEAEKSWLNAKELGFKKTDLHPLEQPDYQKWLADRKNG